VGNEGSGVIGHEGVLRELKALAESRPPAHALLIQGPESTGRRGLAREYARLLNCEHVVPPGQGGFAGFDPPSIPCGACRACRLIAEDQHPDVVFMVPGDILCRPGGEASHASHADSRDIRICQVRGAIEVAAKYPFEARYRVIVIDPAERITVPAANAMLKTLEEPPEHSVFVLLSAAPEQLLETIVSRCRRITVTTVPTSVVEAGLIARGIAQTEAHTAATAARGRPGLAITFAAHPDLMGDRDRLLVRCGRIAAAKLTERFRYAGELRVRWGDDRNAVFRELAMWEEFWERDLVAAAAEGPSGEGAAIEALGALKTVATAREYLLANVLSRTVFDFMLVSFPRRTLVESGTEAN
jgi:DNA polymerase-3 subunit delta'